MDAAPNAIADLLLAVLSEVDGGLLAGDSVLDVGCGTGELTTALERRGYLAYGADFERAWDEDDSRFRTIRSDPYRLPFDSESFDLVTSVTVLEHVRDIPSFFAETQRVLRPGGRGLHLYPSSWGPVERHMWVPFGSRFTSKLWFDLWALLGIRNEYQRGVGWRQVAEGNYRYAREGVNYVSRAEMRRLAVQAFGNAEYPEAEYVRARMRRWGRHVPVPARALGRILFTLWDELLLTRNTGVTDQGAGDSGGVPSKLGSKA